jgi:hypothetical protein
LDEVDFVHPVQEALDVGATREPQVVTAPASHPDGGGPELVGGEVPHALSFGTHTLT